jgi:hypothetical protein
MGCFVDSSIGPQRCLGRMRFVSLASQPSLFSAAMLDLYGTRAWPYPSIQRKAPIGVTCLVRWCRRADAHWHSNRHHQAVIEYLRVNVNHPSAFFLNVSLRRTQRLVRVAQVGSRSCGQRELGRIAAAAPAGCAAESGGRARKVSPIGEPLPCHSVFLVATTARGRL